MIESHICGICNKNVETIEHMLLLCEWTKGCWFEGCHGIKIEKIGMSSFDKWLLGVINDLKGKGSMNVMNEVVYVCWNIWKGRCDLVVGRKMVDCKMVVKRIRVAIREFY